MGVAVFLVLRMEKVRYTSWSHPSAWSMDQILPRPGAHVSLEMEELLTRSDYQQITLFRTRPLTLLQIWTAKDLRGDETSGVSQLFTVESEAHLNYLLTLNAAIQDLCLAIEQNTISWFVDTIGDLTKIDSTEEKKVITTLDATHPFRGASIRRFRVFEFEFPIWNHAGALDWSIVQAAVWDVIDVADKFRSEGVEALDDHLDIRLMSSSSTLLSSFYSNSSSSSTPVWGWAGIAVASTPCVDHHVWQRFMFEVVSLWSKYTSPEGNEILPRPHWAKEMPQFVGQEEIYQYLRRAYQHQLTELEPRLNQLLNKISKTSLNEAFNRFGTQHHHKLFKHFKT